MSSFTQQQPASPTNNNNNNLNSNSPQQNKTRKPYTITKQRENWTEDEHQKFLEALTLYDRDWKKIEAFVGSKTVIQIRSHAQKYFLKVQKTNSGERIPPPRPKRKSVQPYPQKPKQESITIPWVTTPDTVAVNPFINNRSAFAHWMANNGLMPSSSLSAAQMNEQQMQQQEQLQQAQHFLQQAMSAAQQIQRGSSQGRPNFPKIYSFLGSLFVQPSSSCVEALNEMTPIDRETVQLLMHNLASNLSNQQFRDQHALLLAQYRDLLAKNGNPHGESNSGSNLGASSNINSNSNASSSSGNSNAAASLRNSQSNPSANYPSHEHVGTSSNRSTLENSPYISGSSHQHPQANVQDEDDSDDDEDDDDN